MLNDALFLFCKKPPQHATKSSGEKKARRLRRRRSRYKSRPHTRRRQNGARRRAAATAEAPVVVASRPRPRFRYCGRRGCASLGRQRPFLRPAADPASTATPRLASGATVRRDDRAEAGHRPGPRLGFLNSVGRCWTSDFAGRVPRASMSRSGTTSSEPRELERQPPSGAIAFRQSTRTSEALLQSLRLERRRRSSAATGQLGSAASQARKRCSSAISPRPKRTSPPQQ